jgi:hypothetical protein
MKGTMRLLSVILSTSLLASYASAEKDKDIEKSDAPQNPNVVVLKKDRSGCQWIESKATVSFGDTDTKHQAKARAVAKARTQAMEKFLGVTVTHQFMDFQQEGLKGEIGLTQSLLKATRHGRVLKETTVSHGPANLESCTGCLYRAHIKTCIVPMKDKADKGFRVELGLNRTKFVEGDDAEIQVTPTRDSYIYLFNVDMEWNAALLHPNVYSTENKVEAGKTFVYPTEEMRRTMDAKIEAQLPPGAEVSAEMIRVVASRTPLSDKILKGKGKRKKKGHAETDVRGKGTFLDLMRRLSRSEMEWVDDAAGFTIYKK